MYAVVVFALLAVVVAEEKYTTKYDGTDIDAIIKNDRLIDNYVDCIMERGKCTPDGAELKKNIPDALETECSKCSEKQKEGLKKILKYLYDKKQVIYKEIEAKYDPNGKYRKKYKKDIEAEGYKVNV